MGMIGNLIRVTRQELNEFLNDSKIVESKIYGDEMMESTCYLDLDKSWDGINYILTGTTIGDLEKTPNALERALFSFQYIDEDQDLGYGPVQYLHPEQVKETCTALQMITDDVLKSKFNGSVMNNMGIYPEVWTNPEAYGYLEEYFFELKEFYQIASQNNQAIVTYIS